MSILISSDKTIDRLTQAAAKDLAMHIKGRTALLLLSGGSALSILEYLTDADIDSRHTITVLDERYSFDDHTQNFALVMKTDFYKMAVTKGCSFIDTRPRQAETITELSDRFERTLRKWHTLHPHAAIVATQGMGPDGHTAGIMPFPEDTKMFETLFMDASRWVVGYDAGKKNQYPQRITTTIPFLQIMSHATVLVTGENKKEVLQKALSPQSSISQVPAAVIQHMQDVTIFTDLL